MLRAIAIVNPARLLTIASLALTVAAIALLPDRAAAASGWQIVLDRPTPNFGAVDFVSDSEGWMPAGAGLLHTTDGGATWTENAKITVNDVDFFDQQHGWAVGLSGAIYGTSDGGHSWQLQTSGTYVHLSNVVAVDPNEAWASGQGEGFSDIAPIPPTASALLHTSDGGATWEGVDPPTGGSYREIAAVGANVWALAERCETPPDQVYCYEDSTTFMQRSQDGGATWETLDVPDRNVYRLAFATENDGWLTLSACPIPDCSTKTSTIFRTTDAGATWQPVDTSAYGSIESLSFENAQRGWALAAACAASRCVNNLLSTTDGGVTWYQQAIEDRTGSTYAESLVATNSALYLTARSGEAHRSLDGGQSWERMSTAALELWDVAAAGPNIAYAGGRNDILRTDDGGATWRAVAGLPGNVRLLSFTDERHGVAVSWDCNYGCLRIWRTTVSGTSWQPVFSSPPGASSFPRRLAFGDDHHGMLSLDNEFVVTEDGGQAWTQHPIAPGTYANSPADIVDATNAWAFFSCPSTDQQCLYGYGSGSYGFHHSGNRGRTWQPVALPERPLFNSFDFVDAQHGWYVAQFCELTCANTLYATDDAGTTWQAIHDFRNETPSNLAFTDARNGWAISSNFGEPGPRSNLVHSNDGGRTWNVQFSQPEILTGYSLSSPFEFFDANNGWLLLDPFRGQGIGGGPSRRTILYHTSDGGGGVTLPDVGSGPVGPGINPLLPLLFSATGAMAFAASFALRRRVAYPSTKSPS